MSNFMMPRLSDSMEEGTIIEWLRKSGDRVFAGEAVVEIETDKATMIHEADNEGTLEIVAAENSTVAVGEPIARIVQDGELVDDSEVVDSVHFTDSEPDLSNRSAVEERAAKGAAKPSNAKNGKASPVARRIAADVGVDLDDIAGTGPRGRITKADVLAHAEAVENSSGRPDASVPEVQTEGARGHIERIEPTRPQSVIARRMAETKATVPEFSISVEVNMEAATKFREELNATTESRGGAVTINDLIVRASALALRGTPRANGAFHDGGFELYERVNVGIAVAAEGALMVPVIADADRKSLGQIGDETRSLIAKVREGRATPPDLAGGTFTVSNLGMFGVSSFGAIINKGQAGILAVGSVRQVPVIVDSEAVVGHCLTLTLTCDHRILYGADAAEFLSRIQSMLESPLLLTL